MKKFLLAFLIGSLMFYPAVAQDNQETTDSIYAGIAEEMAQMGPQSEVDLAGEYLAGAIDGAVKDPNVVQKLVDKLSAKVKEGVEKGKEWIENGGIRDEAKKLIQKELGDKVSQADMDRILVLTDKFCDIPKDNGKGLVSALGNEGLALADSLAVNEIKKQVTKALPKDVADKLCATIDAAAASHDLTDPAFKAGMFESLKASVNQYLPYENSAKSINSLIDDIAAGNSINVIDAAKNLGTSIGIDALKAAVTKNLDPEAAAKINALIDGYTDGGVKGLTEAAQKEINAAIDKYAPGKESADALKGVVEDLKNGTLKPEDLKNAAKVLGVDAAKSLIDKSNLSEEQKKAAKEAIDNIAEDGWDGFTESAQAYVQAYVSEKLGEDAGAAVGNVVGAILDLDPGTDPWNAIQIAAPVVGEAIFDLGLQYAEKWATEQIDKLIAKNPTLKKIFDFLGINGGSIVAGIKNIWSVLSNCKNLKEAFAKFSQMALEWFKDIAAKLIDWAVDKILGFVNQIVGQVLEWISELLGKLAEKFENIGCIRDVLLKLQAQLDAARTNGSIRITVSGVGEKVINWIEKKHQKSQQKVSGQLK